MQIVKNLMKKFILTLLDPIQVQKTKKYASFHVYITFQNNQL